MTPSLFLAPMEGVVDPLMRALLTELGGIDLCVTEFVRVTDRPVPAHVFLKYCPELKFGGKTPSGVPVMVQLLGGQPLPLAENARTAVELGAPGIDLNFGCPAKTVNRHDGGATLLQFPERIEAIVRAVREAVPEPIPVTAKIRLGFEDKKLFLENSLAAQQGGAKWLTVHARTKLEGYKPPAHWEYIAEIREALNIPVIANGDIWSREDLTRCQSITGCQDFMLGRGLIAKPDLARHIKGEKELSPTEVGKLLLSFLEQAEDISPVYAVQRYKQWTKQLARTYPFCERLFQETKREKELEPIRNAIATTELPNPNGFN